jgi:hypothetical protein
MLRFLLVLLKSFGSDMTTSAFILHSQSSYRRQLCTKNDDDDEECQQPYRNRSLAWTNRYRTLLLYEQARQKVIGMGFFYSVLQRRLGRT